DVGDLVAHVGGADGVGGADERGEVVAFEAEELLALVDVELVARERAVEDGAHRRPGAAEHAIEGLVVERDGLDRLPGLEPAQAEASTAPAAARVSPASAATWGRSAGARKPGRST